MITIEKTFFFHFADDKGHWVGGKISGSAMNSAVKWTKSGDVLPRNSPFWVDGFPGRRLSNTDCLMMRTTNDGLEYASEQLYWTAYCLETAHTLCQG